MIEMPANQSTVDSVGAAWSSEATSDAPEGAFAEMLGRNLGQQRIVSHHRRRSEDETMSDGSQGGSQFLQGGALPPLTRALAATGVRAAATTEAPGRALQPATLFTGSPPPPSEALATQTGNVVGQAAADNVAPSAVRTGLPAPVDPAPSQPAPTIDATTSTGDTAAGVIAGQGADQHRAVPQTDSPASPGAVATSTTSEASQELKSHTLGSTVASPPSEAVSSSQWPVRGNQSPLSAASRVPHGLAAQLSEPAKRAAPTSSSAGPPGAHPSGSAVDRAPRVAPQAAPQSTHDPNGDAAALSLSLEMQATQQPRPTGASQHTALVNRVLQIVEHQQTQPPPRMVVVDMPELEGLRLMVALQNDGKVHIAPLANSAPPGIAEPFVTAVADALTAKGFHLADGSDQRERRSRNDAQEATGRSRRKARRPSRSSGLRI